mmetsp:Transcript_82436/g.229745  ORF Transcript_82436/g.229745 Transcript_82436/m.229745 type:complete len:152 (-) Transcript_82436:8-463(-)
MAPATTAHLQAEIARAGRVRDKALLSRRSVLRSEPGLGRIAWWRKRQWGLTRPAAPKVVPPQAVPATRPSPADITKVIVWFLAAMPGPSLALLLGVLARRSRSLSVLTPGSSPTSASPTSRQRHDVDGLRLATACVFLFDCQRHRCSRLPM